MNSKACENNSQDSGTHDPINNRLAPQVGRQTRSGHANDDGIIARHHQIDGNNLEKRDEFLGVKKGIHRGNFTAAYLVICGPHMNTLGFACIAIVMTFSQLNDQIHG